jgi:hypothetical protein
MTAVNRIKKDLRMFMQSLGRAVRRGSHGSAEESVVFAVTNCYPTRIVLYEAAFQGGWKVQFRKSLGDVLEESRSGKPKAVFYDYACGAAEWEQYCSVLAADGVPFVLVARKISDEILMVLLERGGYHAWGNPLCSEDIVKAVDFAEEVASLSGTPVGTSQSAIR